MNTDVLDAKVGQKIREPKPNKSKGIPGKKKKLWFYISIMAFPVIQFIIFYLIVNANSLLLAFKEYKMEENGIITESVVWFKNIFDAYKNMFTKDGMYATLWGKSLIFYGVATLGGTVFSLAFSYYIYKSGMFGGLFKVMLYLPQIVSTMVVTVMYKYFCEKGLPNLMEQWFNVSMGGFGENIDSQLWYVLFYMLVFSFGSNVLIYTGTMAGISESVIEAAQIDGVNKIQEFFHIIMPSIFSTFALFIITGMITIFNGQGNLFNFYGLKAPPEYQTFGYYMYIHVKDAGINYIKYPPLAALGLCLTSIAIPLIFTLRHLLNKYGPKEE